MFFDLRSILRAKVDRFSQEWPEGRMICWIFPGFCWHIPMRILPGHCQGPQFWGIDIAWYVFYAGKLIATVAIHETWTQQLADSIASGCQRLWQMLHHFHVFQKSFSIVDGPLFSRCFSSWPVDAPVRDWIQVALGMSGCSFTVIGHPGGRSGIWSTQSMSRIKRICLRLLTLAIKNEWN